MISQGPSGSSGNLAFTSFRIPTNTTGVPLISTAKRYTRSSGLRPESGWILFVGHGTGFSKELYEPTIEELFRFDDTSQPHHDRFRIREIWGVDCQSHGEAAVTNETVLHRVHGEDPDFLPIYDYGDAFAKLARSEVLGFDSKLHKLGLIGHSAGSVGTVLATTFFSPPSNIPFSSIILVEPAMLGPEATPTEAFEMIKAMTATRRDIWDTPANARKWLAKRIPWAGWDKRVLDLYIEHGLRRLPTLDYPERQGFTLTTLKESEKRAFDGTRQSFDALMRLAQLSQYPNIQVHLVFGGRGDFYSRENQESLISPEHRRTYSSVRWVPDCGHLMAQESPVQLAHTLFDILFRECQKSKL